MRKISLSFVLCALACASWAQQPLDRSIKPKPGPAPEITLGKTEMFTLPNGMKVFVVENHKLPIIACNMELDIKPELQDGMAGYQEMMDELMLSGTTTRSKDKLNGEIDEMGASIDVNAEGMSASGLKKYDDKIIELMADIAMNTKMTQEELDKTKKKTLSELETEKNEPDAMVRNVSAVVNFGNNHPYCEIPTSESISKVTLARCEKYYHTYFRPNVAYLAIVGDITLAEIKPIIEKYFGKWQKMDVPVATYTIPALSGTKLTQVAFAPRVAAVQSVVSVTYPVDLKPGDPDAIKAKVANTVLGGGSQGRLFLDLREKHAWTYGAYSSLREDELGGSFSATVKCRNIVSDSSVGAILDEMRTMQTDRVQDTSLQNSINYLSGNFAIGLEDPKRVAQYAINIERYHMPQDYYRDYLKNLSAVTADDVTAMARKYITPDRANIVVAGSKDEVAAKLAKYSANGKIDYYDYAGKPVTPEEIKAAPADMTADKVFARYVESEGGAAAISGLKDIKIVGTSAMQGMTLTITEMKKAPNKWKQSVDVAMGDKNMTVQKEVFDGTKGYQESQGKKADLTAGDMDQIREDADIAGDLHPEKYGIKRTLRGMENVNGNPAYIIDVVNDKGSKSVEYYDAASGVLVRRIHGEGEKTQTSDYSNYKTVDGANGYKVPYTVTESAAGRPTITETVQAVEVNKGVADSEFE